MKKRWAGGLRHYCGKPSELGACVIFVYFSTRQTAVLWLDEVRCFVFLKEQLSMGRVKRSQLGLSFLCGTGLLRMLELEVGARASRHCEEVEGTSWLSHEGMHCFPSEIFGKSQVPFVGFNMLQAHLAINMRKATEASSKRPKPSDSAMPHYRCLPFAENPVEQSQSHLHMPESQARCNLLRATAPLVGL